MPTFAKFIASHKTKIVLLFIATTLVITSVFYNNRWGMIDKDFHTYWRHIFDTFVIGRLVKSQQDGVFSAGGLLLVGDTDHYDLRSKTIKHQYDTYYRGGKFNTYWTYNSTSAFEGVVFSGFDKFTNFEPKTNIRIFRFGTSLFSGMALALILLWIELEFGFLAYVLSLVSIVFSPWLILMGGSMYWQLWSLYLPFILTLFLNADFSRYGNYAIGRMGGIVFVGVLMKVLFTGFEFITTPLVALTVPFVYFAVRDNWQKKLFIKRFLHATIMAVLATFLGLFILLAQISSETGGLVGAYQYILAALSRRSVGDPTEYSGIYADALASSNWIVIKTYLSGPAYGLKGGFTGADNLNNISHLLIFVVFILCSGVLLWMIRKFILLRLERKATALVVTTWYSILAPFSWFIVFKAHAYFHVNLDYFVWQLPFMLLGFALVGYTVKSLIFYRKGHTSSSL